MRCQNERKKLARIRYLSRLLRYQAWIWWLRATLSVPHSYVLTWLFVIRDKYVYNYINRPFDRLALCPRRSNQNPAQIPYFDVAFLWLWLTTISSRKEVCARTLFFVSSPTASGVQLPFETNSIWIFSTSVLSFFTRIKTFTHKRSTIGVRNSAFGFGGCWSTDFFRQCSEVHESTEKTTNARNRILSVETDELDPGRHCHFVFSRPGLAFIASSCITWQVARDRWHLLERARLRFHRRKWIVPSKARPTMLAFPSLQRFFMIDEIDHVSKKNEEPHPSDATLSGSTCVYNKLVDKALSTGSMITDGEKRVVMVRRKPRWVSFQFFISTQEV